MSEKHTGLLACKSLSFLNTVAYDYQLFKRSKQQADNFSSKGHVILGSLDTGKGHSIKKHSNTRNTRNTVSRHIGRTRMGSILSDNKLHIIVTTHKQADYNIIYT